MVTVVMTNQAGKSVTLRHLLGAAINSKGDLMMVLPNGKLATRLKASWQVLDIRQEDERGFCHPGG